MSEHEKTMGDKMNSLDFAYKTIIHDRMMAHVLSHIAFHYPDGVQGFHNDILLSIKNIEIRNNSTSMYNSTIKNAIYRIVEGGAFLVYDDDVRVLMDSIGFSHEQEFDEGLFQYYCNLFSEIAFEYYMTYLRGAKIDLDYVWDGGKELYHIRVRI